MIHLPYFDKVLSFAIRGLRVTTTTPGGTLPLFTEFPTKDILGNSLAYTRIPIRYRGVRGRIAEYYA
jgi:hypothetical protein